jgi:hypothetical protein
MGDLTQMIAALTMWVAANSPYHEAATLPPPNVVIAAQEEVNRDCGNCSAFGAIATYNCATKTLTISRDAPAKVGWQIESTIAHELVHHAQCARWGSIPRERWCEAEREAYGAGAAYVVAKLGNTPEAMTLARRHIAAANKVCSALSR